MDAGKRRRGEEERENTSDSMIFIRPSSFVPRHTTGFTLLEVMIAVSILAIVLVSLLGLKSRSTQNVMMSERITTATLLAKREMTEMLQNAASRPKENESEGEFEEEEFRDYSWKKTIATMTPLQNVQITEIKVAVLWKEGERQEMVELVSYE